MASTKNNDFQILVFNRSFFEQKKAGWRIAVLGWQSFYEAAFFYDIINLKPFNSAAFL
jgi:hypothetical protein